MNNDDELKQKLIQRIENRRVNINAYVRQLERRNDRLTNVSIVCTAITAAFTAGPAFGGQNFNQAVAQLFGLASDATVWRSLCLAAVILSITAAIANNMYKSHDVADRLAKAQASSALLEGLVTSIEFGRLPLEEATKKYQQYISSVAFIQET